MKRRPRVMLRPIDDDEGTGNLHDLLVGIGWGLFITLTASFAIGCLVVVVSEWVSHG